MATYYLSPKKNDQYCHSIGGESSINCSMCGTNLYSLMEYDRRDVSIQWDNWKQEIVPFLYCFNCDMWDINYQSSIDGISIHSANGICEAFEVKYSDKARIDLLKYHPDCRADSEEYLKWYTNNFGFSVPQPFPHLGKPIDVIGGLSVTICVRCGGHMEFKGALYDTSIMKFDLSGNMAQLVYHYCSKCGIMKGSIHQN